MGENKLPFGKVGVVVMGGLIDLAGGICNI